MRNVKKKREVFVAQLARARQEYLDRLRTASAIELAEMMLESYEEAQRSIISDNDADDADLNEELGIARARIEQLKAEVGP